MHSCSLLGAVACASLLGTMAHAGVVVTPSQLLWNQRVTSGGEIVGTESFNSYVGYYADTVTGVVGDVTWTASASPSGLSASGGFLRSSDAFATLTFTFSKAVRGVAGNIFGTDAPGIAALSITVASPLPGASVFASIDNLYLAVPSPGAAALVGLAGLLAKRRRV
jgi:hypothetical protein